MVKKVGKISGTNLKLITKIYEISVITYEDHIESV